MKKIFTHFLWMFLLCFFGSIQAQTNSIQLKTGTGTLVNSYNSVQAAYNAIPAALTQGYIIEVTSTYTGANETYPITLAAKTSGHSAANTITLRPALGAAGVSISGFNNTGSIMVLDGVKFFTIDGRAGGVGNSRDLTIINNTTSAGNTVAHTILAQKGSSNLVFRYVNIVNTADLLGTKNLCFQNTTSAMKNVLVEYCKVSKGRTAIGVEGATTAIIDSIVLRANILESWSFAGVWRFGSVANFTIDSNEIYQPVVSVQSPHGGILLDGSGTAGLLSITRNRIYSMQANSEVTGVFLRNIGGQDVVIANNLISMLAPNGSTNPVYGISSTGTGVNNVKVYFNTIRIGGTYTGSAASGAINSSGINKSNSAATASYDFKNNIIVNTRTGGNGVRHAAMTVSSTAGTITANNNSYYTSNSNDLLMFGTTWFTNMNDYRAVLLAPNESESNVYMVTFDSANGVKLDPGHYGDYALAGTPIAQYPNDILGNVRSSIFPYRGAHEAPIPVDPNMVYRTSTAVQKDSAYVNKGATKQLLLRIEVNITGVLNPITVDGLSFSLNGTTSLSDISGLRLFYTGISPDYMDTMQFGSTITSITNTFSISGSLVPKSGKNYFWLAADISSSATLCNLVDAQFTSITISGVPKVPTVSDPPGFLKIKTYLNGTYTINPSLPNLCVSTGENFRSFREFAFNLAARGINGNVNIEVATGVYSDSVEFTSYFTTDTTYEVYIHAATNTASSVVVTLPASTVRSPYLFLLNKVSGLRFEYLTFQRTGTVDNAGVFNLDGCSKIKIRNNVFLADSSNTANNTTGSNSFILSSASATERSIWIEKNTFTGNSNGIWMLGNAINYSPDLHINDNTFKVGYTAAFIQYTISPEFSRNYITRVDTSVTTNFFGISIQNTNGKVVVNRNELIFHNSIGYGIRFRNTVASITNKSLITNNLVQMNGTSTAYGLAIEDDSKFAKIYNNSVYISGGTSTLGRAIFVNTAGIEGMEVVNNILANAGSGFSYYVAATSTSGIVVSDYNILYSKGTNLSFWGANKADLSALQGASLMDAASKSIAPDFIAPKNLRLRALDPLYSGTFVTNVTEDIDGKPRCVIPLIGGSEIQDPPRAFIVDFTVPDTIFAGGRSLYINSAQANDRKAHSWYVDGTFITKNNNLVYTFPNAGTHEIKLVTKGCQGTDSATKQVKIIDPYAVPRVDFIASRNTVFVDEFITLTDFSTQAPFAWEWSIQPDVDVIFNPAAQDPTVLFTLPGKYEVCLTAENAFGKSSTVCKQQFVEVRPLNKFCDQQSSTELNGRLLDDAGTAGVYGNNKNCSFLINPLCAQSLTLKVSNWLVDDNDDMLFIYDGTTADPNKLLALYNGATKTPGGTTGVVATSGSAYLVWVTDASAATEGFVLDWEGKELVASASAGFTLPDTGYVNSSVYITNNATGAKITSWDTEYPGAVNITQSGGLLSHKYAATGTYKVKQTVTGCSNKDSAEKSIVIVNPVGLPVVDFTVNRNVLTPTDRLVLVNTSTNGPLSQKWKISPAAGVTFVTGGDSSHRVRATFTQPGYYDITLIVTNANGIDSITKTSIVRVVEYCVPNAGILSSETGISRVIFEGIDYSSPIGVTSYSDYTNNGQVALLGTGAQYNITIERNSSATKMTRKVWIDWNQDGVFDNITELVATELFANTKQFKTTISVPGTALTGNTRMRVGAGYQNAPANACSASLIGEYEDYLVKVLGDLEKPVITLTGSSHQTVEAGYGYSDSGATAFDNVDGIITSQIVMTGSVDTTTAGTYVLVYAVKDAAGNIADTVRRTVTVTPDATAPQITLMGNMTDTIEVFASYPDLGTFAIDQPWGTVLTDSVKVISALDTARLGTYTIVYQVKDAAGNRASVSRTVVVRDTVKPMLTLKGSSYFETEVNKPFIDPGVNVSDNYWKAFTITVVGMVDTAVLGEYPLEYRVMDGSGNEAVINRIVKVVDRTAPVLTLTGNMADTIEVFDSYTDMGAVAIDMPWGTLLTDSIKVTSNVDTSKVGAYSITYEVTDSSGNTARVIRTVIVRDTEKPVVNIKGAGIMDVDVNEPFADPGLDITDNYWKSFKITIIGVVNTSELGQYQLEYHVEDGSGNEAIVTTRTVNVVDRKAPVIKLVGNSVISLKRWENYTDSGYTLSDNYTDSANITVQVLGNWVNASVEGLYYIQYKATDSVGNVSYSEKRVIDVRGFSSVGADLSFVNEINLYPNPGRGVFTITINLSQQKNTAIEVYDMLGKKVASTEPVAVMNDKVQMDLTGLSKGSYLVKIIMENDVVTRRLVIIE